MSPASGNRGVTLPITITGTGFPTTTPITATFGGAGIMVSNVVVQNASTATATVTIAADAPLGVRTLTVVSPSGESGGTVTFTVTASPPALIGLSPNGSVAGAAISLTLTGTGFVSGASVAVDGGGVTVSEVTVVSGTVITARVSIDAAAELGARTVTVTTDGGTAAQAFAIAPPGPTLIAMNPAAGRRGTTVTVALGGSSFVPGATTVAISGSGVAVVNVSGPLVAATGRTMNAAFAIDANASPGPRQVTITTPGGTSAATTFTVATPLPTIGPFTANPGTILRGESTRLSWSGITDATACHINRGVGDVSCTNGSIVVSPADTTQYELAAVGEGGREWKYVNVTVQYVEPAPTPTPDPVVVVPGSETFSAAGSSSFTVPAGVTSISVTAHGARGGNGARLGLGDGPSGADGARVVSTISVTAGEVLTVIVGGAGGTANINVGGAGGSNGGGTGGNGTTIASFRNGAGGGGGASEVRRGSTQLLVAGGGGGGAGSTLGNPAPSAVAGPGGAGGQSGTDGTSGVDVLADPGLGGAGATPTAGGAGGTGGLLNPAFTGAAGTAGQGGASVNANFPGGGGGGGVFGGGAGGSAQTRPGGGGGGGSSLGPAGSTFTSGVDAANSGAGKVVISWP